MPSENTKRIAKNTLSLYFRMLLTMLVSLFTVRIVLNTLGVVDYGIYNVVGGVVLMFSFLSNTMASASQRFFAFELGKNDIPQLKKTFSLTVTIYAIIAVVVFLLAETIGLWFLNTHLVIPPERMNAANWVYQFTIVSFLVTIMTVPYNAAIIAHENMDVYAYVSIAEVILRLSLVYALVLGPFDKLKLYACLMFAVTCVVTFIHRAICENKYEECRFRFYWDKGLFITLISFSGWSLFGAVAGMLSNYGVNILLNIFFNPIINAARSIAYQLSTAINQFVTNYYTAVRPQVTKYYAAGDHKQMMHLVFQSSKFSFYLIFVLSMPMLLETNFVLTLWLKKVPEYVVIFTQLVIIGALIDSLSYPLMAAAAATGKIEIYQMVVGGMLLLNLPVSYCFLRAGYPPQITMYVAMGLSSMCLILRLWILKGMLGLSIREYFKKVVIVIVLVAVIAYVIPGFFAFHMKGSFYRFIIVGITGGIASCVTIYLIGLSVVERRFFNRIIRNRITSKNYAHYQA